MSELRASTFSFDAAWAVFVILSFVALWKRRQHEANILQVLLYMLLIPGDWFFRGSPVRGSLALSQLLRLITIGLLNWALLRYMRKMRKGARRDSDEALRYIGYLSYALALSYELGFERSGVRLVSGEISHSHFDAFYLLAITWTTVGFGDVLPVGHWGKLLVAMAAVNGYILLAVLIAVLVPRFLAVPDSDAGVG